MTCLLKTCDVFLVFIQMLAGWCLAKQNQYPSTDGTKTPQYLCDCCSIIYWLTALISCIWSVSNSSCRGWDLKFAASKMHFKVPTAHAGCQLRRKEAIPEGSKERWTWARPASGCLLCQISEPLLLVRTLTLLSPQRHPNRSCHMGGLVQESTNKSACENNCSDCTDSSLLIRGEKQSASLNIPYTVGEITSVDYNN